MLTQPACILGDDDSHNSSKDILITLCWWYLTSAYHQDNKDPLFSQKKFFSTKLNKIFSKWKMKLPEKNFIKSLTESEIAAKLNFSPFTGLNIKLNMIIHKQKEANTGNFCSISPSKVTDLLGKNDASKKRSSIYKTKITIIKLIPSSKRYQFMTHIWWLQL